MGDDISWERRRKTFLQNCPQSLTSGHSSGTQLVRLSTLLLVGTARGDPRGITSLAASVSALSILEERRDLLRTLVSSSTAIRASVETLLAAPSVLFSTGEADT